MIIVTNIMLFVYFNFVTKIVMFVITVWVQHVCAWNSAELLRRVQVLLSIYDARSGASRCGTRRQKYVVVSFWWTFCL